MTQYGLLFCIKQALANRGCQVPAGFSYCPVLPSVLLGLYARRSSKRSVPFEFFKYKLYEDTSARL